MMFNIYIANHGKRDGVEDFVTILSGVISRQGHEVAVSEGLDEKKINIVIDEFTNIICNEYVSQFRGQYPETKLVLVLTEFIERRLFVRSCNFFGGVLDAAVIAALSLYLRYRRKDFLPAKLNDWLVAAFYSPLGLIYFLNHLRLNLRQKTRKGLRERLHSLAYLQMRYLGLEKMVSCADGLILSHDMIAEGISDFAKNIPILGTIYPEIDPEEIKRCLFKDKQLLVEITGSVTPYRRQFVRKLDGMIMLLGMRNSFQKCHAIGFGSAKNSDASRGAYSLHPPQTKRWKYASPTRIYRALQYDHNMPVLTRVFDQHPIEKLCLIFNENDDRTLLDMYWYYKRPETLINHLDPLLSEYMEAAERSNEAIFRAINSGIKE